MAARTAEAVGLWLTGTGSLCTCGVMVANGLDEGWEPVEVGVAVLAGLVVVTVAVLLIRFYRDRGRAVPGRPDRNRQPERP